MSEENLQNNVNSIIGVEKSEKSPSKPYDGKLKPLRTYQGDVSDAIGKNKVSAVSIAVAEQKRKSRLGLLDDIKPETKNRFYVIAGTIFFLLGILAVGIFYYLNSQNKTTATSQDVALLNYSQEIKIPVDNITRGQLIQGILAQKKSFSLPINSILFLNTVNVDVGTNATTPASPQNILPILAPQIPPELLRHLSPDYMFGIYSFDKNQPFIILTVDDYGGGFSGMLRWESSMISDIGLIFDMATTSAPQGGYAFSDESLSNKDLRVVQDSSRKTVLLYSFVDKNTVIITVNETTFKALLSKYLISKMTNNSTD